MLLDKKITFFKYLFSIIFTMVTMNTTRDGRYVMVSLVELIMIIMISELLVKRKAMIGIIFNDLFCLLYNVQMAILLFGNSYLQLVMLSNLGSLQDLEGKALQYISGALLVLIFSFLPIRSFGRRHTKWKVTYLLPVFCIIECVLLYFIGTDYSPIYGYAKLASQEYKVLQMKHRTNNMNSSADDFYSAEITDYVKKDSHLPDDPNIILIFTEGLSQNIVDDERDIMPHVADLQTRSINFSNYYNHTFATYRGLIGQLYSGYQLENLDENKLIAIQDILGMNQYHTAFINTEPDNVDFAAYIQSFGFDEVLGSVDDKRSGMVSSYSDKEAYELLFDTACSLNEDESPFFLSIYTFGTHASFDSVDEVYGDGSDRLLNKFHNLDTQLGNFLEKFEESSLYEDTIIIFTTDHATYQDSDFMSSFPDYYRMSSMVDEIPLCIYYKDVVPENRDVNGRNSLDLAPTILDLLDLDAGQPNYFLGTSLFADGNTGNIYDTIFNEEAIVLCTKDGVVSRLNEEEMMSVEAMIQQYLVVKVQNGAGEESGSIDKMFELGIGITPLNDKESVEITYQPKEEENYDQIRFYVWSTENGQDDVCGYLAELRDDGAWHATVDLTKHTTVGELNIHVYAGDIAEPEFLEARIQVMDGLAG